MFRSTVITLILCLAAVTAQAALLGRAALTSSGTDYQAYYDDVLNITWLADANLANTNAFGVTGIDQYGMMAWTTANQWIAAMNTASYLGLTSWRRPAINPVDGITYRLSGSFDGSTDLWWNISAPGTIFAGSTGSEMAHLYYNTLGNQGGNNFIGQANACLYELPYLCLANTGPFTNLQAAAYWSGSGEYTGGSTGAYSFSFGAGYQTSSGAGPGSQYFVWAVHDGDPFAVAPIPASVWLFGSALGLVGVMRRKIT